MILTEARAKTNKLLGQLAITTNTRKTEQQAIKETALHLEHIEEAQGIAQRVAQGVQQQAHDKIAGVVSKCLEAVFEEPYDFKIYFEQKRGKTEARLVFERDGLEVDPMTASGGGVVDVAAFALQLSCLILSKPPLRKLMILDEPFKFVSAGYLENVRMLLEGLAKEFDMQFIMVTHLETLKTGKIVGLGSFGIPKVKFDGTIIPD